MSKYLQLRLSSIFWLITSAGEEVKNSATVVPQSMLIAQFISGAFAVAFSIAILFGIGDITSVLQTPTNYPIIQIFLNATRSKGATTAMVCALISTLIFSTFGLLACASRLAWAFSRDKGFPFSAFFAKVRESVHKKAVFISKHKSNMVGLIYNSGQ